MTEQPKFSAAFSADEQQHFNDVAEQAKIEAQRRERREFLKSFALVLAAPAILSGWVYRHVSPRIEQRVEYIPIGQDGVPIQAYRIADLPPEAQSDMAVNTAWYYVWLRESFSSGMADHAWRIVSLMSDATVQREYQNAHIISNKESPYAKYAEKRIKVSAIYDSYSDLTPPTGYVGNPPGYVFRFNRVEEGPSGKISEGLHVASLRFHRNVSNISPRERREFNAAGLLVWEYVAGQPIGVQRSYTR